MSLLSNIYQLESVLKKENVGIDRVVEAITSIIGCNGYLIGSQGEIMAMALPNGNDCVKSSKKVDRLKPELRQRFAFIFQTAANIPVESCFFHEDYCARPNLMMTIIPVRNNRTTSAWLLLTKPEEKFTEEQLIMAEISALVTSVYLYENSAFLTVPEQERGGAAKMVLDSLSFSELKAISNVFKALNGTEGFLVASKIADRIGVSRSVIVNAMRKLESAGVVESRSLGIKGTHIKVKNMQFYEMLKERA